MVKTKKKRIPRLESICRKLKKVRPVKWINELAFTAGPKAYQFRTVIDGVTYRIVGFRDIEGLKLSLRDKSGAEIETYEDVRSLYKMFDKLVERQRAFDTRKSIDNIYDNMHYLLDKAMAEKNKLKK